MRTNVKTLCACRSEGRERHCELLTLTTPMGTGPPFRGGPGVPLVEVKHNLIIRLSINRRLGLVGIRTSRPVDHL